MTFLTIIKKVILFFSLNNMKKEVYDFIAQEISDKIVEEKICRAS
jgi:hypothetical protein